MRIGLDPDRLLHDMQSHIVRRIVADDVALAKALNVSATPTIFLDGRRLSDLLQTPVFFQTIAYTHTDSPTRKQDPVVTGATPRGAVLRHVLDTTGKLSTG